MANFTLMNESLSSRVANDTFRHFSMTSEYVFSYFQPFLFASEDSDFSELLLFLKNLLLCYASSEFVDSVEAVFWLLLLILHNPPFVVGILLLHQIPLYLCYWFILRLNRLPVWQHCLLSYIVLLTLIFLYPTGEYHIPFIVDYFCVATFFHYVVKISCGCNYKSLLVHLCCVLCVVHFYDAYFYDRAPTKTEMFFIYMLTAHYCYWALKTANMLCAYEGMFLNILCIWDKFHIHRSTDLIANNEDNP